MSHYNQIGKIITVCFFLILFVVGNFMVKDYGLGFDDEVQEEHGWVSYDYVNKVFGVEEAPKSRKGKALKDYQYRSYNVVFQVTALYLEKLFGQETYTERHLLRHRMVFCLFFIACFVFYNLLFRQFGNRYFALLGALFFVLSPRMFGHAFFNVKDSVLLSFFMFGIASFFYFLDNPTIKRGILHALICGLVVNIRIVGIIVPVLSLAWILVFLLASENKRLFWDKWKKSLPVYLLFTPLFIILFWPFLWAKPIDNFIEAFKMMSQYPWKGFILFEGKNYYVDKIPWYYGPKWMLISIPLFYWLLFTVGVLSKPLDWMKQVLKGKFTWLNEKKSRFLLIGLSFFLVPILAVLYLDSVLYDGWRQLHFTYAGFLLVVMYGLWSIYQYVSSRKLYLRIASILLILNVGYLSMVMIQMHPHQYVYLNALAGSNTFESYEMDYWGISYRNGYKKLEKLLPETECKKVFPFSFPGKANHKFLSAEMKEIICLSKELEDSDYYITNFRSKKERTAFLKGEGKFSAPVFIIERQGAPILGVFALEN